MSGMKKFSYFSKSGFVRSVFVRVLTVFIVVSIIIAVVAFYSFTSEISSNVLADNWRQLASVEKTISDRMDEITSIAYNIGTDSVFYLEPVDSKPTAGHEMVTTLERYIVGNNFIEHLAYYRISEQDKIYTSSGERSLSEFLTSSMGMDKAGVDDIINGIQAQTKAEVIVIESGTSAYFACLYPLPQLSTKPQAYVLALIPTKSVQLLMETLFINSNGEVAVYDADGMEIYRTGNLGDDLSLNSYVDNDAAEMEYTSPAGDRYIIQKMVSDSNGWTYVAAVRHSDTLSGLARKQVILILFMLLLLIAAITVMLAIVIHQYKPISKLAEQVAEAKQDADKATEGVDERALLSHTIAALRDDSEQKQRFESAYHEAEAASQAKSAFLSSMSHDIRTPMNAIVGMTALAIKNIDDKEYVEDCLKKVQLSSDYLLDIINNVLDMSRIESGRVPISEEPVYIPALIDSVVSLMTSSVDAKSQTLNVDIGELKQKAVLGDNIHIIQVFVNILSNAVKFTPQGGTLTVKVRQMEADDEQYGSYVFSFSDTGIGIPPEFIGRVFDTFTRAEGQSSVRTEGTGLGMAIAKKLVEMMGGTICCESELGRGTTFTVTLPMKPASDSDALSLTEQEGESHSAKSAYDSTTVDLSGKRILLVEDNAMNIEIARRILSETRAEVLEAHNGREALEAFNAQPAAYFDLILMDIQMPIMNGYKATAEIRSSGRADAASIKIYAMTANTFDEDVRQVREAGMNGHISKPYNPATLYKVLAQAFNLENSKEA